MMSLSDDSQADILTLSTRILLVIYVSCLSYCLFCSLQPCGHLLGKG